MSLSITTYRTLPVAYPDQAVARAIDDCRAAAGTLADDLTRRADTVAVARAAWAGVHRRSFDAAYAGCTGQLAELRDRLLRLAASLHADRAAAARENAVRAALRAEVEAEHRRQEQTGAAVAP